MLQAPLCQREKWQGRGDYRARTITGAIANPSRAYMKAADRREHQVQADMEIGDDLPTPPLPKIMSLEEMERDLVHVGFGSQIIHRHSKTIRNKDDAATRLPLLRLNKRRMVPLV